MTTKNIDDTLTELIELGQKLNAGSMIAFGPNHTREKITHAPEFFAAWTTATGEHIVTAVSTSVGESLDHLRRSLIQATGKTEIVKVNGEFLEHNEAEGLRLTMIEAVTDDLRSGRDFDWTRTRELKERRNDCGELVGKDIASTTYTIKIYPTKGGV